MHPGSKRGVFLLALSYLAFVSLGLPDGLLGVAWPSIRASFHLPLDSLGALLVATTIGYVSSAFASGRLLSLFGLGELLAASCLATSLSLLGYAWAPAWAVMVPLGLLAGLGAGAIDACLNTYVATNHSARMLHLIHACYGLGTTAGPMIMTQVLMAHRPWQRGYQIVGVAQLALAACFATTRSLWPPAKGDNSSSSTAAGAPIAATLRLGAAWLAIAAFFFYVGIEASAGAWTYTLLSEGRGITMEIAGWGVGLFWGGLMAGRIVVGVFRIPLSLHQLLRLAICGCAVACGLVVLDLGQAATLFGLAALGFCCGPIFSGLVATTPLRLGAAHTANAVGFQIAAAALGQSLLPTTFGIVADARGIRVLPYLMLGSTLALFAVYELLAAVAPLTEGLREDRLVDVRQPEPDIHTTELHR
jgi:fucose permease